MLRLLLLLQLASLMEFIAKIIRDKFPTLLIVLLLILFFRATHAAWDAYWRFRKDLRVDKIRKKYN